MAVLLHRLGAFAHRRRRAVLTAWLLILVAVGALAGTVGGTFSNDFAIPGSGSQQALDELKRVFPAAAGATAQIVFVAPVGTKITDPGPAAAMDRALAAAWSAPEVAQVVPPVLAPDGRTALAQVAYPQTREKLDPGALPALEKAVRPARQAGLEVEFGGSAYGDEVGGGHVGELAGVLIALVVLLVTFGSIVAAGVPLLTALLGVGTTSAGMIVVAATLNLPTTAPTLAIMLGLAVGIDYALFIVARHRTQLGDGMPVAESAARATATAGSAVVFAGLTVIIALAGLAVVRIPFLTAMGLGAAAAVIVAVAVALTLIPALLGFAGPRLRPRRAHATDGPESEPLDAHRAGTADSETLRSPRADATGGEPHEKQSLAARWVTAVTRRPLPVALAVVIGLGVVAVPAAGLRLALPDNGSAPADSTQRKAYDLVAQGFGPGFNGPLIVLVHLDGAADPQASADAAAQRVGQVSGVARVGRPQLAGGLAQIQVVPATGPQDRRTEDLVRELESLSPSIAVTGVTAIGIDISERLSGSLLPFALIVVGLALLLLMVVFRSIVVPVKAALGFLLSIGSALGATVAVFQWGWLADAIGVARTGPVLSFMPIILMAVLFGLAMDYEVFLVARMHEEYAHTREPLASVRRGFGHAARVVAAAALIMIAVFASFVPGGNATIKPIAFALAFGVLVDAVLVRMTLVPAVLALAGRWAWWLPRWLARALPDLDIEGAKLPPVEQTPTRTDALMV